jgi:hypothetical protein
MSSWCRILGKGIFSTCRIPVVQKNGWCRIPGEIFIMSNRKRLRQGGKFVRKTVNTLRIDLRPSVKWISVEFWVTTFLLYIVSTLWPRGGGRWYRVYIDHCIILKLVLDWFQFLVSTYMFVLESSSKGFGSQGFRQKKKFGFGVDPQCLRYFLHLKTLKFAPNILKYHHKSTSHGNYHFQQRFISKFGYIFTL